MKRSIIGSKNSLKVFSCLLVFLLCGGAAHAKSYRSVLRKWSHSKQLFSPTTMQAKIIWNATYYSPEFRRAFVAEHVKLKTLDAVEAARFLADEERKQAEGEEFFIGMYTRKSYQPFSLSSDTFWEAVLTTESGEELKPIRINFIEIRPYEQVMFPYLNRWSQAYRVVFPKTDFGKKFKLTLRSVIGQTTLTWD